MSTHYTENFDLCQWEPTDPVIRTDFNADNAKIEAALSSLEERVAMLYRTVPDLAYYIGHLEILDMEERQKILPTQSMVYHSFKISSELSFTGQGSIQNGALLATGAGTVTTAPRSLGRSDWTQVKLWLRYSGTGTITPHINNNAMEYVSSLLVTNTAGQVCSERTYTWNGVGNSTATFKIAFDNGGGGSLSLYDFRAVFF